jgi:hypothetical protein
MSHGPSAADWVISSFFGAAFGPMTAFLRFDRPVVLTALAIGFGALPYFGVRYGYPKRRPDYWTVRRKAGRWAFWIAGAALAVFALMTIPPATSTFAHDGFC